MLVRPANPSDTVFIHRLIQELADYERAPDAVINTPELLLNDLFVEGRCHAIVAEHGEEIIGFALYYFGYSTWKGRTLYLEDLYVQEDFRKAGVGQQLFDQVVMVAIKEKVRRMDWQVLTWNDPALAFYRKNNAILDDEWINGRLFF